MTITLDARWISRHDGQTHTARNIKVEKGESIDALLRLRKRRLFVCITHTRISGSVAWEPREHKETI